MKKFSIILLTITYILVNYLPISATELTTTYPNSSPTIDPSDRLHFGHLWSAIRKYEERAELIPLIVQRKQEIASIKESWRPFVQQMSQTNGAWQNCTAEFHQILEQGQLISALQGGGSAYFLIDAAKTPRFVVKPFDEDMLCLHNRKKRASPFRDSHHRVRSAIPLYETIQRELSAAEVASILEIDTITPTTILAIIRSDSFYDISDALDEDTRNNFIQQTGLPDKEKLCTVQPFFPESIDLGEAIHEWFEAGQEHADIPLPLEPGSFEDANLFMWVTYDCDGHGSNFLLYFHSLDKQGQALYGIKKIDNGLCFPSSNKYLLNYLAYLPNAKLPLSERLRTKIMAIDRAAIVDQLISNGLCDVIASTETRISTLKILAKRPEITIEEMNLRMEILAIPRGEQLARSECTREQLEQLALEKDLPLPSLY